MLQRLVISLYVLALFGGETRQTSSIVDASAVWEKIIAAKGGRERLDKIQNVLRSSRIPSKVRFHSFDRQLEELFIFSGKYWEWIDERPTVFGMHAHTRDYETMREFFVRSGQAMRQGPVPPETRRHMDLIQVVELLETNWIHLRPLRTWSDKKGGKLFANIECKFQFTASDGATVIFAVDPNTFLVDHAIVTFKTSYLDV